MKTKKKKRVKTEMVLSSRCYTWRDRRRLYNNNDRRSPCFPACVTRDLIHKWLKRGMCRQKHRRSRHTHTSTTAKWHYVSFSKLATTVQVGFSWMIFEFLIREDDLEFNPYLLGFFPIGVSILGVFFSERNQKKFRLSFVFTFYIINNDNINSK